MGTFLLCKRVLGECRLVGERVKSVGAVCWISSYGCCGNDWRLSVSLLKWIRAIHLWRPHGGGGGQAQMDACEWRGGWGSSPMWTSTQKI